MKIGYLVFNLDGMGGTSRSAITQANALAADHDITMLSVTRSADAPHYAIDSRITVVHLVDVRDDDHPAYADVAPTTAKALHARESALVPARWDKQFTALCDVALESTLPSLGRRRAGHGDPGLAGRRDRADARPGGRGAPGAPLVERPHLAGSSRCWPTRRARTSSRCSRR